MTSKTKKSNRHRNDMEQLQPEPKHIPDTFENVIRALVKPVAPKKEEEKQGY